LAIVYCGAVAEEALAAHAGVIEDVPGAGLLAVTSPDRLHADWLAHRRGGSLIETLLAPLGRDAALVTILDGHPAALSWLGSAARLRVEPLGVDRFGQSGDIPDLYRAYGLDCDAIIDAVARACLDRLG
jgi:pyruvate dehydrogenase E1 component